MKKMANLTLLLVFSVILATGFADDNIIPQPSDKPTPNITTTSTTVTPKTTTSTTVTPKTTTSTTVTPHTTTTPKTTTTTTTTTTTPKTTTSASTTTAAPTTTTATTTVSPSTTTPQPKPIPDPQTGNWSVLFPKSNNSCLVVDAAIQIEVLLKNTSNKFNLPMNATADGFCKNNSDSIVLKWDNNTLSLNFNKNVNESKFELVSMNLVMFKGNKSRTLIHNATEFATPLGNSYKCAKVQTFNLTAEKSNVTEAYLHLSHVQVQAFANATGHKFDAAVDCEAAPITSDVVPIVVGCVLVALVIMIMVAYLVARRRCQARGYLSIDSQPDD